jgi:hypothetical protein
VLQHVYAQRRAVGEGLGADGAARSFLVEVPWETRLLVCVSVAVVCESFLAEAALKSVVPPVNVHVIAQIHLS